MASVAVSLGAVWLVSLPAAEAWTLNYSPPRKVPGQTLLIGVNYTDCPSDIDVLVEEALAIWNSVPTSYLHLQRNGASSVLPADLVAGRARDFVIVCDASYAANTGADPLLTLAAAVSWGNQGQSEISGGGVLVNVQTTVFTTSTRNQKIFTLAHELGHVLGLGHSTDTAALMYYEVRPAQSIPTIAQDDIDAMSFLYARNELSGENSDLFGCGQISDHGLNGPGGPDGPPSSPRVNPVFGALSLLAYFVLLRFFLARFRRA